MYDEVTWRTDP